MKKLLRSNRFKITSLIALPEDPVKRVEIPSFPAPDDASKTVPVYGNWKNFTSTDGLPADKCYCMRIDVKRSKPW